MAALSDDDAVAGRAALSTSLTALLEHVGSTLIDLVAGNPGSVHDVRGVHLLDHLDPTPPPPGALLLAVATTHSAELLDLLTSPRTEIAGLVVRPELVDDALREAAAARGLVLLALSDGASWPHVVSLLGQQIEAEPDFSAPPAALTGELFDLANAICTLIDAPVTVEDRHNNVLAFSDRQDESDVARVAAILGRGPESFLVDGDRSAAETVRRARGVVYIESPTGEDGRRLHNRAAVAIRVDEEFLGAIWAIVDGPLSSEREGHLLACARLVAQRLLRLRSAADARLAVRSDLVEAALGGGPRAAAAIGQLGLAGLRFVVAAVAFDVPGEPVTSGQALLARRLSERQRIALLLDDHLGATTPGAVAAVVNDQVYALVPGAGAVDLVATVEASCRAFVARSSAGDPLIVGIGRVVSSADELPRSRDDADRTVRVIREHRTAPRVARAEELDGDALLLEARSLVALRGHGPTPTYRRLRDYDEQRQASMLGTLRSWLDHHGDAVAAAEAGHVHQNTFRYRMRRIEEIGECDLSDPTTRFELALQLRLFGAAYSRSTRR